MQETDSKQLKLPDRKEITLCEAVTALVFGKANDAMQDMLYGEAVNEEKSAEVKSLLERLHSAAYAGRIKFRALKNGDNHADGHRAIDSLYFSEQRGLRWNCDEIWVRDLSPEHPKFKSKGSFTRDWRDVHLDRQEFEAFLLNIGVGVQQSAVADGPGDQKIFKSGLAGRPTSINLVLPIALSRLNAGDYPDTQTEFSEQLAEALAKTEPQAPRMTPKAIRNNPKFKELWRRKPPKIIDPS